MALDEETRAEVRDVLTDTLAWRLVGARWDDIRSAVDALGAALRSGDVGAVQAATTELELLGPVRATPIGREPTVPAPDPVIDEINELVGELEGFPPPPPNRSW